MKEKKTKSGVVALVGPPNVGKSTLLNGLLGQKISIVSPKPQTTRNRIAGIVSGEDYQMVILDTPGIHEARSPLNFEMVKIACDSLSEVDLILFMTDVTMEPESKNQEKTTALLKDRKQPTILLINKIDLIDREKLLPMIKKSGAIHPFTAIIPISARKGDGLELLTREVVKRLPEGPMLYPPDIPTDVSERFIVGEIIREKVFLRTSQEVPYSTAVIVDDFSEGRNKVTIQATIIIERPSQKGIIIGKGGKCLKDIGVGARKEIEVLLGKRVNLKLWVKVKKDWSRNPRFMKEQVF